MWSGDSVCRATLFLIGSFLLNVTNAGRFIELETNGKVSLTNMNDYGVPVTGYNKVLFEVKACSNAYVVLSREVTFKDKVGKYFFIMLGAGKSGRMNGIKDSCIKCLVFNEHTIRTTVKCDNYTSIFLKWDGKGSIQVGVGTDETNVRNIFLRYKSKSEFAINYVNVLSNRNNASWRFRVDGEPKFTAPEGHGATVIQVPEDTAINKEIYTMKVLDPEDDNVTFMLGDKHKDVFQVVGSSLMLAKPLDFETQSFYSIDIKASDGFNTISVTMAIRVKDVNDEPPTLYYNDDFKIPEEMPVGYVISGLFSAIDKDTNDNMTFKLEGGDTQYFDINASSGKMMLKQRIDYDGPNAVKVLNNLTLVVVDKGGNQVNQTLKITLEDVNDNTPMFEQTVFHVNVIKNGTKTLELTNFTITDLDSGKNGEVIVTISDTGGAEDGVFTINGTSLFVDSTRLDYDHEQTEDLTYSLTVQAVDTPSSGRVNTGKTTVIVQVSSKNKFSPKWTSPVLTANSTEFPNKAVSEDVPVGTPVETFKAKDGDFGKGGSVGADGTVTGSRGGVSGANGGGSVRSGGNGKRNDGGNGNGGSRGESCSTVDISKIENWALRGSCGLLLVGVICSLLAVYKMKKSRL